MTPEQFIQKWRASTLKERSAAQSHFIDLCRVLGVENPTDADQKGDEYCFERGASKTVGGEGWADVWKRGCFGWEYKGKRKDLKAAFAQLQQYSVALENPPLLIVSDMETIEIHTNWTNTVSEIHILALDDLKNANKRELLRAVFLNPERLKPKKTIDALTREVADKFAGLAQNLRDNGHDPQAVAHFVNRLVFCMFAEDINFLPSNIFTQILDRSAVKPEIATHMLSQLFSAMRKGGVFGVDEVAWFNGGLFDDDAALPLTRAEIKLIGEASAYDWSDIDPSIFGTLFERGLDPNKRSQLGAHYTDAEKIMMIIRPVIVEPLWKEWEAKKAEISKAKSEKKRKELHFSFLERLRNFRVLDPACGSGNFLYLALLALKDVEHRVNLDAEAMGLGRQFPAVGPDAVMGIEINAYAAELARVTIWIGEIQWMRKNGFDVNREPILKPLNNVQTRDAILDADGIEALWPEADAIIGNPPFLGDKKMYSQLGRDYTDRLRKAFKGQLVGRSDLVCYWFAKARRAVLENKFTRVGLVATNSIKQKSNRGILTEITDRLAIFEAWSDEPWTIDGAAVRVSIICFSDKDLSPSLVRLDGAYVDLIYDDLTGANKDKGTNLSKSKKLAENSNISFQGIKRVGQFEIPSDLARSWIKLPLNPNGRNNSDVLRPWASGFDILRRPQDFWIVDFGWDMPEQQACLYEAPFEHVKKFVKPERVGKREQRANEWWWIFYWPRPEMRKKLKTIRRYIATPSVAKHRIFRWVNSEVLADGSIVVIAKDDDVAFGVLQSRIHTLWATRSGSTLEDRPAYTPTTSFETFPFPKGLEPNRSVSEYNNPFTDAVASAAKRLDELRENWLNPADLIRRIPEVVAGYPDQIEPVGVAAKVELRQRTLTNLYNQRPAWLTAAHEELDKAVAGAYGWPADLSDDEILKRLLDLNTLRAVGGSGPGQSSDDGGEKSGEDAFLV